MKNDYILYAKLIGIYFLIAIISTIFCVLATNIPILSISVIEKISYLISLFILCLLSSYILKTKEKKAYIHVLAFLGIYFLLSLCCKPFIHHSMLLTFSKIFITSLISILILLRK